MPKITKNCKFCQLAKDEKIIFKTKNFIFLTNKFPVIKNGHFLLISKNHFKREKKIDNWLEYKKACTKAYNLVRKITGTEPLVFINPPQMQSIGHFHRHYLKGIFGIHGVAKALENFLKQKIEKG